MCTCCTQWGKKPNLQCLISYKVSTICSLPIWHMIQRRFDKIETFAVGMLVSFSLKKDLENHSQIMHLWKSYSVLVQLGVDFPMNFELADLTFWPFFSAVYPCYCLPAISPSLQFLSLHHCTSVCGTKYSIISPFSLVWRKNQTSVNI